MVADEEKLNALKMTSLRNSARKQQAQLSAAEEAFDAKYDRADTEQLLERATTLMGMAAKVAKKVSRAMSGR